MSNAEQRLAADRDSRKTARGLFERRLQQVREDLTARPIPARIKANAQERVLSAVDTGFDIAKESKGIIAATVGALTLWLFRKPLVDWLRDRIGQGSVQDDAASGEASIAEEQQS